MTDIAKSLQLPKEKLPVISWERRVRLGRLRAIGRLYFADTLRAIG